MIDAPNDAMMMPTETMEVEVPPGCSAGDEICVMAGDQELVVVVPPGCQAGDMIDIRVPSRPSFVDIELPPTSRPGEQLELHIDGKLVTFTVPDDCPPGSPISIQLPARADDGGVPPAAADARGDEQTGASDSHPAAALPAQPPAEAPPQCKFWPGLEVEVLRTSGQRTFGVVEAADWASGTYTLKLTNGLLKHMVEEADLAHLWAGKYRTGEPVTVRMGRRSREGRIASHDDDDGTYGVFFGDGETVDGIRRTNITQQASPGME